MEPTIGEHLARIRRQSTLTQEQLAERAGVSVETVRKLERGERASARMTTLHALARALDVPTTALLGDTSQAAARREPDARPLSLAEIRRTLTPARGLGGPVVTAPDGPPPTLDDVRRRLGDVDAAYHRGDYAAALAGAPRLLDDAGRVAVDVADPVRARAYATLAQARYLATELLIQLRAGDLAYAAVVGALDAAEEAGDPVLGASTVKGSSWLLLRQGRLAEAEQVAIATADAVEPRLRRADPAEVAVWGWLLLAAAAAAARDNRPDDAAALLDSAAAAAARLADRPVGGGHLAILGGFRSARVEMMRVEAAAVAGDAGRVLQLAERVPAGETVATSWQRHRLDVAWAHAERRQFGDATGVLLDLRDRAPAWLRHQRYARDIVQQISDSRRRAMSTELAELATLVGCTP
ncbi:helix-turn-helix transcriptional regulator [Micromonospora sp. WMMD1082]|uniref:helix-turn-helix domain-containing protein n=1 Tax=Micromonospora sp. WMMD1082 TaxID=3016104 RepID=UPI0024162535|nr:helix-turn-helix transcriptional regulator [Micromonospora sp. WMMD1082]MDG4792432.1 helix-turn-helix transcriptional regulator [Micromonospora sp. WMMD1082]